VFSYTVANKPKYLFLHRNTLTTLLLQNSMAHSDKTKCEGKIINEGTHHTITVGLLQLPHLSGHLYPKVNFVAVLEEKRT
jgi:hypothetical protein